MQVQPCALAVVLQGNALLCAVYKHVLAFLQVRVMSAVNMGHQLCAVSCTCERCGLSLAMQQAGWRRRLGRAGHWSALHCARATREDG